MLIQFESEGFRQRRTRRIYANEHWHGLHKTLNYTSYKVFSDKVPGWNIDRVFSVTSRFDNSSSHARDARIYILIKLEWKVWGRKRKNIKTTERWLLCSKASSDLTYNGSPVWVAICIQFPKITCHMKVAKAVCVTCRLFLLTPTQIVPNPRTVAATRYVVFCLTFHFNLLPFKHRLFCAAFARRKILA